MCVFRGKESSYTDLQSRIWNSENISYQRLDEKNVPPYYNSLHLKSMAIFVGFMPRVFELSLYQIMLYLPRVRNMWQTSPIPIVCPFLSHEIQSHYISWQNHSSPTNLVLLVVEPTILAGPPLEVSKYWKVKRVSAGLKLKSRILEGEKSRAEV
jgi:hypothetical protein